MANGAVEGVVNSKVPGTLEAPPERVELERVWPTRIAVAVGGAVIVGVPFAMLNVNRALLEKDVLLAVIVALKVPAAVGVPVMEPLLELSVKPAGKAGDTENVCGPLVAVTFWEKATPTVPLKVAPVISGKVVGSITIPDSGIGIVVAFRDESVRLPERLPEGAELPIRTKIGAEALPPD